MTIGVEIYSKAYCPYCDKAKALFDQLGVAWEEKRIDLQPEMREELLKRLPSARTMPQIFIHGQHVGGCDDLYALHQADTLSELLESK